MFLSILEMVVPIFGAIALGMALRKFGWMKADGITAMKGLVSNILLPVVLFNAFFTADYSARTIISFILMYAVLTLALGAGFVLRRFEPRYGKYLPFLVTSWEGGMLGYSLCSLLGTATNSQSFATFDIGQTFFSFTMLVTVIGITDGKKPQPKAIVKSMVSSPCFCGMLLGTVLGALGIGKLVTASLFGNLYTSLESFITAPTSCLILLSIGYEFSLKKEMIAPVLRTALLRLAVLACACVICAGVLFTLTGWDKPLFIAMLVGFTLPAAYIVPIYIQDGTQAEYVSTTLSVETLLTMLCFVGIAAYAIG